MVFLLPFSLLQAKSKRPWRWPLKQDIATWTVPISIRMRTRWRSHPRKDPREGGEAEDLFTVSKVHMVYADFTAGRSIWMQSAPGTHQPFLYICIFISTLLHSQIPTSKAQNSIGMEDSADSHSHWNLFPTVGMASLDLWCSWPPCFPSVGSTCAVVVRA